MEIKVRSKRTENRYYIDNEFLNGYAAKVGWKGHIVYSALCRHEKNGKAFPGLRHLAKELGVSVATVARGVKILEEYNIIQIEKPEKKNQSFTYWITNYINWKDIDKKNKWFNQSRVSPQKHPCITTETARVSPQKHNNTNNNNTNNKGVSAKADPHIKNLIDFFYEQTKKIVGIVPEISGGRDGTLLKRRLKKYTPEQIKDLIVWYLESKECDKLGATLSICLSSSIINKWKMEENIKI